MRVMPLPLAGNGPTCANANIWELRSQLVTRAIPMLFNNVVAKILGDYPIMKCSLHDSLVINDAFTDGQPFLKEWEF